MVSAEIWTHNARFAAVICVIDEETKSAVSEPEKLTVIENRLLVVINGYNDMAARITVCDECVQFDRRLYQMMFAYRDEETRFALNDRKSEEDVVKWNENVYSVISIRCQNTPSVLFDMIFTLTELNYIVYHGKFGSSS